MDTKEIVFTEEEQKQFGGVKGVLVYMDGDEVVDEKEATSAILNIYDEQGNNVKRIYGEL